jgi:hypothetical protein
MNLLVASSTQISSDFDGVPNSKKEPYILDNPNTYVGTIPCPSTITSTEVVNVPNGAVTQTLVVWTTGLGVATPTLGKVLVGETIGLTAVPNSGWTFLNWSGAVSSGEPTIAFRMPPTNAVLTANFIPTPYIGLAGTYNGLFYQTTGVTSSNSGFVSFTVTSNGVFSGHLQITTNKYSFSSQFYGDGLATVTATNGTNQLTVTLQLDTTNLINPSIQATGSVVNGTNWDAMLLADVAPVWTTKKPAPQQGSYTMALAGSTNAAASPGGDSYGTVTVDSLANLSTVLNLADGVTLSQSVPVAASGMWPLYLTPLTGVAQPLIGWISFNTNAPAGFSGLVSWNKAAGPGLYYTNGFDTHGILQGSIYASTNYLLLTNPVILLSGGNLATPLTNAVSLSSKTIYKNAAGNLTLTITSATGLFTGSYTATGSKVKVPLAGAVLQDQNVAEGFFLGTNQSGAVLLQGE